MAWSRGILGRPGRRRSSTTYAFSSLSSSSSSGPSISLQMRRWRLAHLIRSRIARLIAFVFLGAALLRVFWEPFREPEKPRYGRHLMEHYIVNPAAIEGTQKKLVIILPIDKPLHDLCKVVSSAVALGYPPPVIVNWRKDFHTNKAGIGPSHLAKAAGTLEFLDYALNSETAEADRLYDDDLVIMLDALDVWFQLPPVVLLHRYYAVLEAATKRLEAESGFSDPTWMRQKIVVAAQKACHGPRDSVSNLHCDALPESTLPRDIYGVLTDSALMDNRWKWRRPFGLNSGSFMGPAKDVRSFFRRVQEKIETIAERGEEIAGDQGVFAGVFGEQEAWRRDLQARHAEGDWSAERKKAQEREKWDFGLTLDYTQELFYPTSYSEHDGQFRVLDEEETRLRRAGKWSDIDNAKSPLAELKYAPEGPEGELELSQMQLFIDSWTGAIPAVLHHNAWRFGLKTRRKTMWNRMWYFPYLRRLLRTYSSKYREAAPVATWPASNGTMELWPYGIEKEEPRKSSFILEKRKDGKGFGMRSAEWAEICKLDDAESEGERAWYDEVFRDGAGPFKAPSRVP